MRARGGPGSPPHEGHASTAGGDMQFQPTCLSDNLRRTILSDSFLKGIRFHPLPLPAALHVEREARRHPRPELRTGCGRREASGRKGVGELLAGFLALTCHSVSRRKHLQRLDDAKKPIEPFSSGPRRTLGNPIVRGLRINGRAVGEMDAVFHALPTNGCARRMFA